MSSHLNAESGFDATPVRALYHHTSRFDHSTRQSSSTELSQINTIRCSAEHKLRMEAERQDRNLRHVLGHLALLEHIDEEMNQIRQQRPIISSPLSRSHTQQKLDPFGDLSSPQIEVCEEEFFAEMDDDSDSSTDGEDVDDFDFWDNEDDDSDHTLVRVQSHLSTYAIMPTPPSERKDQSYQLYAPHSCARDQNELLVTVQELEPL